MAYPSLSWLNPVPPCFHLVLDSISSPLTSCIRLRSSNSLYILSVLMPLSRSWYGSWWCRDYCSFPNALIWRRWWVLERGRRLIRRHFCVRVGRRRRSWRIGRFRCWRTILLRFSFLVLDEWSCLDSGQVANKTFVVWEDPLAVWVTLFLEWWGNSRRSSSPSVS